MTDFSFPIVGFDLDGTLVDTSSDLAAAANHALSVLGRKPMPVADVVARVGGGTRQMLSQVLDASGGGDDAALGVMHDAMLGYYADHIADRSRPYPGVVETLDALAARGVRLGVVTNKSEALACKLLAALDLDDRFACIIGGNTLPGGETKPDAAPIRALIDRCGGGRTVFVGDSRYDIAAARAAGVASVAVSYGFSQVPVATLGADAVIDRFDALPGILETLDR